MSGAAEVVVHHGGLGGLVQLAPGACLCGSPAFRQPAGAYPAGQQVGGHALLFEVMKP